MSWGHLVVALIGAYVLYKIGGWLISWARRALAGFIKGALAVVRKYGELRAYAMGEEYSELEVVDEIEVDEDDLDPGALRALRRHGVIVQKVHL